MELASSGRPEFVIGERKVRNGQARVLMPHGRAQQQLAENKRGGDIAAADAIRRGRVAVFASPAGCATSGC